MKIYTAEQIREWDKYTISNEPVLSVDLMERAATKCYQWLIDNLKPDIDFEVFCGMGNNGGDGLAIARMLCEKGRNVVVYVLKTAEKGSDDFETNLKRLKETSIAVVEIKDESSLTPINEGCVIIDALFGTGLKRPLDALAAKTVTHINNSPNNKVSIDVPSGLPADWVEDYVEYKEVVKANYTLTFQVPKQSFLFAEMGNNVGNLVVLDIALSEVYQAKTQSSFYWVNAPTVQSIYKPRNRFSHKGTYGHALIIGGSFGKAGAVLMASKAAIKAGAGLTSAFVPRCTYTPLQTAVPEAMVESIQKEDLLDFMPSDTKNYTAIGIGPGMGTQITTRDALDDFLAVAESDKLVIDADALNCLSLGFAERKKIKLPVGAILTPHPKEFDRMFGESTNSWQRLQKQIDAAKKHNLYIVLKGTHTSIALPTGEVFFNSTGNPGMATGGSGDVLTGIITALRAQGYSQKDACILGVYLHGLSGDMALAFESEESLAAVDLIGYLGKAFKTLQT